ncbi:ABC transporter permease (plasmid) [Haloferax mediterranei ATCC 33500]|uniref:ABC transporter permease n=1 Tax=Haloferax mediterranei (strain ATCC 33500 / DSM 1411 / JCM 8866 / NBRC 14739 / NCIMB 2177 / R-4) TaxID=523841 RepID=I3R9W8_HALMT|nr:ABC transporter permease [Haloferax mediterranei]AFK21028.1 ABC-type dipeptide/oligopeptide/nickel transport systems, permease protein [Haloferax mediterranei ATCC 33500]AHZ24111.1 peptide ABC transporter [Haloferax mediterranei ATCC 33500]EMA05186.1 ABC-type dipeptide/oligopeptide/nickel transport system, permease protein [Haloferax mediterranei ATCC 33500]MDX5990006.1 ABC transporter permease [Haloferax mediterranei ATCC 33500]QCQ77189.1 ABC transporter permease [Haloferax mediterranei AT
MGYKEYLIKRGLSTVPMFVALSMLIFTLARVIPGRPARLALGPRASDEAVQQLREQMGLNDPLWIQYIDYLSGLVQGDLGQSLISNRNVAADLVEFFPATFELTTLGMLIAVLVGVPLGVVAGMNKDGWQDNLSRVFSFFNVSLPPFWAGILLQLVFAFWLGWLPATSRLGDVSPLPIEVTGLLLVDSALAFNVDAFTSAAAHLLLPAITLSLAPMADIARMTRSSFIEEYDKDYVEGLETHGIPNKLIAYKYVLRKSFASTLTIIGLDYGFLLGSAFVVEIVFSWPGMASYGVTAILQKDINAMVGVTLVIGGAFLFVNFVVDVLYGFFDPRVWHEGN